MNKIFQQSKSLSVWKRYGKASLGLNIPLPLKSVPSDAASTSSSIVEEESKKRKRGEEEDQDSDPQAKKPREGEEKEEDEPTVILKFKRDFEQRCSKRSNNFVFSDSSCC